MSEFSAPPDVWEYLARCAAAESVLPVDAAFLDVVVTISGTDKRFGDLTPADFMALASAERQRITAATLARLDRVDDLAGGAA